MAAGAASIVAHGVVLVLVVMVIVPDAPARHSVELTPIQVVQLVEPTPPPPAAPPLLQPIGAPSPGTLGRRSNSAPRSATRAPADPYSDLIVHYDAPASEAPGNRAGATGLGIGAGPTGDGIGDIQLPATPTRARPARPKHDYSRWGFRAAPVFRGAIVRLELAIDATGAVRGVRIVKGVDDHIDREATTMASRFEFHPALDDDGRSVASRHGWEFVIQ
jgi:hypothetical protein